MKKTQKYGLNELLLTAVFLIFLLNFSMSALGGLFLKKSFQTGKQHKSLSFNSDQLKELYKILPAAVKDSLDKIPGTPPATYLLGNNSFKLKNKIRVCVNEYGEFDHIGLMVFQPDLKEDHFRLSLEFIERELLAYLLLEQNKKIIDRMNFNKVKLSLNGIEFNNNSTISSYIVCDTASPFLLERNSKMFYAAWKIDGITMLTMEFPNDYLIISGKRKDELEKGLARDLMNLKSYQIPGFQKGDNKPDSACLDFYMVLGDRYNESPGFTSDYFCYTSDSIIPVFDTVNFKESLNNLLLNIIPTSKQIQLKQKLYGNKTENYSININDFYNFFGQNHQFFLGWQSTEENHLKASIIIQSTTYAYIHLLIIETDKKELFSEKKSIRGTLYAFIPKNNLKQ